MYDWTDIYGIPKEYVRTWRTKENFVNNNVGIGVDFSIGLRATRSIDTYFGELKAQGVTVINEPATESWRDRIFTIPDPDNFALTFSEHIEDVTPESRSTSFNVTHFLINLDMEKRLS